MKDGKISDSEYESRKEMATLAYKSEMAQIEKERGSLHAKHYRDILKLQRRHAPDTPGLPPSVVLKSNKPLVKEMASASSVNSTRTLNSPTATKDLFVKKESQLEDIPKNIEKETDSPEEDITGQVTVGSSGMKSRYWKSR